MKTTGQMAYEAWMKSRLLDPAWELPEVVQMLWNDAASATLEVSFQQARSA